MKLIKNNKIYYILILLSITISLTSPINEAKKKNNKQLYQEAKLYKKNGNFEKALNILIEITNQEPDNIQFFNALKNILKIDKNNAPILEKHVIQYCNAKKNDSYSLLEKLDYLLWIEDEKEWPNLASDLITRNIKNTNYIRMVIGRIIAYNKIDVVHEIIKNLRKQKGMEDFFALEMANYFKYAMQSTEAINEYFLFLNFHPEKYENIEEKILSFSDNDSIEILIYKKINEKPLDENMNKLKAALEYQKGNFINSYSILNDMELTQRNKYDFAYDLFNNENELILSKKIFSTIINNSNNQELIQKSILQLAKIFEIENNLLYRPLKISGFYDHNLFFHNPFLKIKDTTMMYSIQNAMVIYDSLVIKNNNIEAKLRLAKIYFQILGDWDKASILYEELCSNQRINKNYYLEAILNLINIKIAKGDLSRAMEIVTKHLNKNNDKQIILYLEIKKNQILFYKNELDTVLNNFKNLLLTCSPDFNLYNDIAEIISILQIFKTYPNELQWFTKSQYKIMQNKNFEAISIINENKVGGSQLLIDLKQYYHAYLLFLNDNIHESLIILNNITGNTIFAELAILLSAEINDYIINDKNIAIEQYIQLLEKFPDSIYYEDVRLRLREIVTS